MDSFVCGICQITFHKLEKFLEHKQSQGCQNLLGRTPSQQDTEAVLEAEANICEARLPVFSPTSQFGTMSTIPTASVESVSRFSIAPSCDTSSISLSTTPVNSPAPVLFGNDKITSAADNKTVVDFGGGMVMESVSQIMIPASHETAAFHTGVNMVSHNNIELSASTMTTKTTDSIVSLTNNRGDQNSDSWTTLGGHTNTTVGVSGKNITRNTEGTTGDSDIHIIQQSDRETTLLSGEGLDFNSNNEIGSASNEVVDLTYASSPGLYTLLLNADNTFTLVAGGYHGSSSIQGNQVFVCRPCKKFAQSQVEILNHISTCHPGDLDNVNQSVWEFSALPSSCSESSDVLNDTDQLFHSGITLNVGTASQGSGNCLVVEQCVDSHLNTEEILVMPKGTVKRKLGRPKKKDTIATVEPTKETRFKIEENNIVCIDCRKSFSKQRQFDKHRCCMWQNSLEEWSHASVESFAVSQVSEDKMKEPILKSNYNDISFDFHQENLLKEDVEEEWRGSKCYRAKVKSKLGEGGKRKRGRPPKVDTVPYGEGSNENCLEQGSEIQNQATDDKDKPRSDENVKFLQDSELLQSADTNSCIKSSMARRGLRVIPKAKVGLPSLHSIPTLPLFSNPRQQERLHKWIAQVDLSFVDSIIDKVSPEREIPDKRGMVMYACRECKVLFRTLLSCRRHCAKHMSRKAFSCPDCDFATTNVGALYSHYRNHTQNLYACDKCDFKARIKAHYRDHLETHSPSRHICKLCQRPYSTSNSLKSHIYLNHRNEEGLTYLLCLRRKNLEQNKRGHIYQCPVCCKMFNKHLLANKHIASHGSNDCNTTIQYETRDTKPLHHRTLKKYSQKHKVIFICCVCCKPQLTASCLRNHLKKGFCNLSQGNTYKQSLLSSYTLPETFPSLVSNKRLGIATLLQDLINHLSDYKLPDTKVHSSLIKQMKDSGYKQIYEILQDQCSTNTLKNAKITGHIMKIVVDTGCTPRNKQCVPKEQQIQTQQHTQHEVAGESQHDPEHYFHTSLSLNQQEFTVEESDQRVVVISNVGEEQIVVVEEGQMVLMDEERFVIIHEDIEEQPSKLATFLPKV